MYPLLVVFPEILALGLHYVTAFARSDARATPPRSARPGITSTFVGSGETI